MKCVKHQATAAVTRTTVYIYSVVKCDCRGSIGRGKWRELS